MLKFQDIYDGAEKFLNQVISKEAEDQGHSLTDTMTRSFKGRQNLNGRVKVLTGTAVNYLRYVNDGVRAQSASFKQAPFLIEYFKARGESEENAVAYAFATIKKWMKEGMSTQASKRFSKTGARQNFVESAMIANDAKLDEYMSSTLDHSVEEHYRLTKSETI